MDLNTFFGLWMAGSIVFIGISAYKSRHIDISKSIRKPTKPTWPRTELEEVFGV
ncbi:hypothetical protein [Nitrosopumilus maritimus]|uniref:hypothetical protein n=1 Tax=Nitrosopumilus maritimus TaxID=338192 RepID=UPI000159B13F|nr:hypothetical protein [Nitrosopumilus maritimus]